jgi:hypothetical protein
MSQVDISFARRQPPAHNSRIAAGSLNQARLARADIEGSRAATKWALRSVAMIPRWFAMPRHADNAQKSASKVALSWPEQCRK